MVDKQNLASVLGRALRQHEVDRRATVVSVGGGTVDVLPAGGNTVIYDVPLAAGVRVEEGDEVIIRIQAGKRIAFSPYGQEPSGETHISQNISIVSSGGGGGGGGMEVHDLDGAWHFGSLSWSKVSKAAANINDLPLGSLPWARVDKSGANLNDIPLGNLPWARVDKSTANINDIPYGNLPWARVDKTGSDLAHLETRNYTSLNNRTHAITGGDHSAVGSRFDLVGCTSANTLGMIIPSHNPGAAESVLKTDAAGHLQLVRLGIGAAPGFPLHVVGIGTQIRVGYDANNYLGVSVSSSGQSELASVGNIVLGTGLTANAVHPKQTYKENLGLETKRWLTLHAAELMVETLVARDIQATTGGRILVGPTTHLTRDMAASGSSYATIEQRGSATVATSAGGSSSSPPGQVGGATTATSAGNPSSPPSQVGSATTATTSGGSSSPPSQVGSATTATAAGGSSSPPSQVGSATTATAAGGSSSPPSQVGSATTATAPSVGGGITQVGSATTAVTSGGGGGTPAFVAHANNAVYGTTLEINRPSGTVQNHVMVALVVSYHPITSSPSGWTQIGSDLTWNVSGYTARVAAYYRVAGASEPSSYTWTNSGGEEFMGYIATYSGVDTGNPIDVQGSNTNTTSSTSITGNSVTTTTANAMLLFMSAAAENFPNTVTVTPPSGMTERVDATHSSGWANVYLAEEVRATAGATGNRVATISQASPSGVFMVALRSAGGSGNSSLTISRPTGVQENHVMLAALTIPSTTATITAPTGWTQVLDRSGTNGRLRVWRRVAGASEPSGYTWSLNTTNAMAGAIIAYSGVDTTTPVDVSGSQANNTASTNMTAPSVTTTVANTMLVMLAGAVDTSAFPTATPPSGMTEEADTGVSNNSIYIADQTVTAVGATGTRTATLSASRRSIGALVALRPAAGSSNSLTINRPTGVQENHLMLAAVTVASTTATITAPSGWTQVLTQDGTNGRLRVWSRLAGASEPSSYQWSINAGSAMAGSIIAFSGVDTSNPVNASNIQANNTASTSMTAPEVTTTVANTMLVMLAGAVDTSSFPTATPPSGMNEEADAGVDVVSTYVADQTFTATGATGTRTATLSASRRSIAALVAVAPAPASSSSITIDRPSGVQENHLMLAAVTVGSTSATITAPSGWTQILTQDGTNGRLRVWSRLAGASEPSNYQWSVNESVAMAGTIIAYSGVDTNNPVNASNIQANNTASTNMEAPEVTTTTANTALVMLAGAVDTAAFPTATPPSGMNEEADTGVGAVSIYAADQDFASSGATGTRTATLSASRRSIAALVAIAPTPTANSSITINRPSGVQENHLMLAAVTVGSTSATITAPSGWTQILTQDGADGRLRVWRRLAGASEPSSYQWSVNESVAMAGTIIAYSGVDTNNPVNASNIQANNTASTNMTAPEVTTTVANTMLVMLAGAVDTAGYVNATPPSGMNEEADTGAGAVSIYAADQTVAVAGATGTRTATLSASRRSIAALVAVAPQPATSSNITIDRPSGVQENHLMLAAVTVGSTSATITAPSGWTQILTQDGTNGRLRVWRKLAGASEPSNYQWSANESVAMAGTIIAYSGVDTNNPVNASNIQANNTASTNMEAPGVTTTVANTMLVMLAGAVDTAAFPTATPPSGMTEEADVGISALSIYAADQTVAASGPTGTRTATLSASRRSIAALVAVAPVPNTSNSVTVDCPTGVASGNFLLATVSCASTTASVTPPSGWNQLLSQTGGAGRLVIYTKTAGGSEPSTYQFSVNENVALGVGVIAYSGVHATNPVNASGIQANDTASTNMTAPAITTTADNTTLVMLAGALDTSAFPTATPPSGFNEEADTGVSTLSVYIADATQATAGSTGSKVATLSASRRSIAALVALAPPPASSNSVTVSKPTGVVQNDYMLAAVGCGGTPTITAPSGWTQLLTRDAGTGRFRVYGKLAGANEPANYQWSIDTSASLSVAIISYYNIDTANPVSASNSQSNASSTSMTAPSVTPATTKDMLVMLAAALDTSAGSTTVTPPSGMGEDVDDGAGTVRVFVADELLSSSSATGSRVATLSAARASAAALLTLRPAVTGGSTTMYVRHSNLAVGDRVRLEARGKFEFMAITAGPTTITQFEEYMYTVTRNLDGTGANDWLTGDAVFNTGTTDNGWIDLYSDWSVKGAKLEYIFKYNGSTFDSTNYADVDSWEIIDSGAAANKMVYYGMTALPWENLHHVITWQMVSSGYTATLEYWNGSAWVAVVGQSQSGGMNLLGPWSWLWSASAQTGWAPNTVNGVQAYWVRMRSTGGTVTTPPWNGRRVFRSRNQRGPTIVGWVRNSGTWNDFSEHWAIGNLSGLYDYGSSTYGVALGKYSDSTTWVSLDARPAAQNGGLRFMRGNSEVGYIRTDGTWRWNGNNFNYIHWNGSRLSIRGDVVVTGGIVGTGNLFRNSSFELDSNNDGLADNWGVYSNTESATPSIVSGFRSPRAQRIAWTATNTTTKGIYASIPGGMRANVPYTVSFWARCSHTTDIDIYFNYHPVSKVWHTPTAMDNTWRYYAVTMTWASTVSDNFHFSVTWGAPIANGWIEFDNVMIAEADAPQPWQESKDDTVSWSGLVGSAPAPSTSGLYLSSTHLGYYDGTSWRTYLDNVGRFYFRGSGGAQLQWTGSRLEGYNSSNQLQWYADAVGGYISSGNGKSILDASGFAVYASALENPEAGTTYRVIDNTFGVIGRFGGRKHDFPHHTFEVGMYQGAGTSYERAYVSAGYGSSLGDYYSSMNAIYDGNNSSSSWNLSRNNHSEWSVSLLRAGTVRTITAMHSSSGTYFDVNFPKMTLNGTFMATWFLTVRSNQSLDLHTVSDTWTTIGWPRRIHVAEGWGAITWRISATDSKGIGFHPDGIYFIRANGDGAGASPTYTAIIGNEGHIWMYGANIKSSYMAVGVTNIGVKGTHARFAQFDRRITTGDGTNYIAVALDPCNFRCRFIGLWHIEGVHVLSLDQMTISGQDTEIAVHDAGGGNIYRLRMLANTSGVYFRSGAGNWNGVVTGILIYQ